ncbi:hypothetical protein F2P79_001419 [Pimephales promelas]|nr:hypothetical protein F2P79_001419 [Pimephales promelas]
MDLAGAYLIFLRQDKHSLEEHTCKFLDPVYYNEETKDERVGKNLMRSSRTSLTTRCRVPDLYFLWLAAG